MPEGCNGRAQRLPAKIGAVLPAHILHVTQDSHPRAAVKKMHASRTEVSTL